MLQVVMLFVIMLSMNTFLNTAVMHQPQSGRWRLVQWRVQEV